MFLAMRQFSIKEEEEEEEEEGQEEEEELTQRRRQPLRGCGRGAEEDKEGRKGRVLAETRGRVEPSSKVRGRGGKRKMKRGKRKTKKGKRKTKNGFFRHSFPFLPSFLRLCAFAPLRGLFCQ